MMLSRLAATLLISAVYVSCVGAGEGPLFVDPADFSSALFFEARQSSVLNRSQISQLEYVAETLESHPKLRVLVKGHADTSEGSEAECNAISERRAKLVFDWLAAHGFESRLKGHEGFGKSQLVDFSETEEQRRHNRRVELAIE